MTSELLALATRRHVLRMTHLGRSSHVASCLSCADILSVLYADVLRHDPSNPGWPDRDRLILSKGHAGAAIYAVLAECGYSSTSVLDSHYADGSNLSGHVSHVGVPGVDVSTGALGHGLSIGTGMALAAKRRRLGFRTFVVLGDGECDEGSVWEAAMFAGHHRLGDLVAIVDCNGYQSLTTTTETLDLEPFPEKWRAFGWEVEELDGHDHRALRAALHRRTDAPLALIARTIKGKGVSYMEHDVLWHYRSPDDLELAAALEQLEK